MGSVVKKVTGALSGTASGPDSRAKARDIDESGFKRKLAGSGTQEAVRQQQSNQSQRLTDRATGKAPSIAEAQLKAATDRSLSQQLAAAQSRRGGSAASRERQLAKSSANANQMVNQQSAVMKLQERQQAESQLGSQLATQRQQDIGLDAGDRASTQDLEKIKTSQHLGVQSANMAQANAAAANKANLIGGLASGGMMAMAASDENQKKNIKTYSSVEDRDQKTDSLVASVHKADKKASDKKSAKGKKVASSFGNAIASSSKNRVASKGPDKLAQVAASISDEKQKQNIKSDSHDPKSFLDALQAHSYEYKNPSLPGAGEGRHLSVMAQDLEKAGPVGKQMVQNTDQGKMVDYGKGFGAMLANQAHLNERLSAVESKKKKK